MQPRPMRKPTGKLPAKPAAGGAPTRGTAKRERPAPPAAAKKGVALYIGIGVGGLAVVGGLLYAAGIFEPNLEPQRQSAQQALSASKKLIEDAKYDDAIAKCQSALDALKSDPQQEKLSPQLDALKAGLQKATEERDLAKTSADKWTAWKKKFEGADGMSPGDRRTLMTEAEGLTTSFARRPWWAEFNAARARLDRLLTPAVSLQPWKDFLADLEQKTKFTDATNGQWSTAFKALKQRALDVPDDGKEVEAKIKDLDRVLQTAFTDCMLTAEGMKKKGQDAVKFLTDKRPNFAGTHAEVQYDELIETIKKK